MKYEIKSVSDGKSRGTVFINKKGKIDTTPPNLKDLLDGMGVHASIDDAEAFMEELPNLARNGYWEVKKIND